MEDGKQDGGAGGRGESADIINSYHGRHPRRRPSIRPSSTSTTSPLENMFELNYDTAEGGFGSPLVNIGARLLIDQHP